MKKTLVHICLALAATSLSAQAAPNGKEQVLFAAGKTSKSVSTTIQGQNVYDGESADCRSVIPIYADH